MKVLCEVTSDRLESLILHIFEQAEKQGWRGDLCCDESSWRSYVLDLLQSLSNWDNTSGDFCRGAGLCASECIRIALSSHYPVSSDGVSAFVGTMRFHKGLRSEMLKLADGIGIDNNLGLTRFFDDVELSISEQWLRGSVEAIGEDSVVLKYMSVFEQIPWPALLLAVDCSMDRINMAARRLASSYVNGQELAADISASDAFPWLAADLARLQNGVRDCDQFETEAVLDGSVRHFRVFATRLRNKNKDADDTLVLLNDITDKCLYQQELDYKTHYDALTGFPNRKLFTDRLSQSITQLECRPLAVMFIDIDRFNDVNEAMGHTVGDALLKQVSQCIAHCLRDTDTLACMGGDEFAVIVHDVSELDDVESVAGCILGALNRCFAVDCLEFYVSASVGASRFPANGLDAETLIRNANTALRRAKSIGSNSYHISTPSLNAKTAERFNISNRLRKAVENNDLELYYQPIVELSMGRIIGCEALLRWPCLENGFTSPSTFIPVAEETGLIVPISELVLMSACAKSREWAKKGYDVGVAVNLSAANLRRGDLVDIITRVLAETGAIAERLRIEITETVLMDDLDVAISQLIQLKSMGISISLDDFGTGYSSLHYLKCLPIDTIKIARSFVSYVTINQKDAAIAEVILSVAKAFDLSVVAEGVETQEQLEFFRERGCDEMQGFLVSPAVPAEDFDKLLRRGYWLDGNLNIAK